MTEPTAFRWRSLFRGTPLSIRTRRGLVVLVLRLGSAAILVLIGYIHLHLWQEGYRQIPTDGPMFLADALAAFGLAAVLLARTQPARRPGTWGRRSGSGGTPPATGAGECSQ